MARPKIVYNSVTLQFSDYPQHVSDGEEEDVRHDNIASSGKAELVYERTEEFVSMDMERIPESDLAAWKAWRDWAKQGNTFDYYPDAGVASFTTYTLENKSGKFVRRTPGTWQLTGLKFRKWV